MTRWLKINNYRRKTYKNLKNTRKDTRYPQTNNLTIENTQTQNAG